MSCRSTHAGSALNTIAKAKAGYVLSDAQVQSLFHELKRNSKYNGTGELVSRAEYKNFLSEMHANLQKEGAWPNGFTKWTVFTSMLERLKSAKLEEPPTRDYFDALTKLPKEAKKRADNLLMFCEQMGKHMGLTKYEIARQFREGYAGASAHTGQPSKEVEKMAKRYGLSSDFHTLSAVSLIMDQVKAVENKLNEQLTTQPRVVRTPVVGSQNQKTSVPNYRVIEAGRDPRNGHTEILVQNIATGSTRLYSYHYFGYEQDKLHPTNLASGDIKVGEIWSDRLRGDKDYQYPSTEGAKKAARATNCTTCGQFANNMHACPMKVAPIVLTRDNTIRPWSRKKLSIDSENAGMSLPPLTELHNAFAQGAVTIEGITYHENQGWNGQVFGDITAFYGSDGTLQLNAEKLGCGCSFARKTGRCAHTLKAVAILSQYLSPVSEKLSAMTDSQRIAFIAKAQAKVQATEQKKLDKLYHLDWSNMPQAKEEASKHLAGRASKKNPLYSQDFDAFQKVYKEAKDSPKKKSSQIPYMKKNALGGFATRESKQGFGVELEYDFPSGWSENEKEQANERIAEALKKANLIAYALQEPYHTAEENGYTDKHVDRSGKGTWSFEHDSTVSGELVSPTMYDEPETWEKLEKAIKILKDNGAVVSTRAGSHVHVGTGIFKGSPSMYAELSRVVSQHQDTLYRLASDPNRGTHRGLMHTPPIPAIPPRRFTSISDIGMFLQDRGSLTYASVEGRRNDHVEFRVFDATLDPGIIQTQIKIAVAMTQAAQRQAKAGGTRRTEERLGIHAELKKLKQKYTFEEETATFRSLLDTLFTRKEDKDQAIQIFAKTKWVNRKPKGK